MHQDTDASRALVLLILGLCFKPLLLLLPFLWWFDAKWCLTQSGVATCWAVGGVTWRQCHDVVYLYVNNFYYSEKRNKKLPKIRFERFNLSTWALEPSYSSDMVRSWAVTGTVTVGLRWKKKISQSSFQSPSLNHMTWSGPITTQQHGRPLASQ